MSSNEPALSPPGPGSWQLDTSHFERPLTRYLRDLLPGAFAAGQARWLERYGIPMKTVAAQLVDGFVYVQPIPLMGKPGAKPPPAPIFKLALRLVPALRRRRKQAERAARERRWREDARRWTEEIWPRLSARYRALQAVALAELDDPGLLAHVGRARAAFEEGTVEHFATNGSIMIPAGMFIAEVMSWDGVEPEQVIDALSGSESGGRDDTGAALLDRLATALAEHGELGDLDDREPAALIASLRARDDRAGQAARAWLDHVGPRQICAGDLHLPTGDEVPGLLVEQLRTQRPAAPAAPRVDPAGALRAQLPAARRARYDELLAEARATAYIRDQRSTQNDLWSGGLLRRALLEVGRRLAERGLLDAAGQAVHLGHAELESLLLRGDGPDRDTIRGYETQQRTPPDGMPPVLGDPPPPPPPVDAAGGALAGMLRGLFAYLELMEGVAGAGGGDGACLRGFAASPGVYTGVARVMRGPEDFGRVKRGDVLIARATMPSYNGAVAVAGAIVTDRGGALSHAAIVSRELGIPAVVGTMTATQAIADGARVRVNGGTGMVEVLA